MLETYEQFGDYLLVNTGINILNDSKVLNIRGNDIFNQIVNKISISEMKRAVMNYYNEQGKYHKELLPIEFMPYVKNDKLYSQKAFYEEFQGEYTGLVSTCFDYEGNRYRYLGAERTTDDPNVPLIGFFSVKPHLVSIPEKNAVTDSNQAQAKDFDIGISYLEVKSINTDLSTENIKLKKEITYYKELCERKTELINKLESKKGTE